MPLHRCAIAPGDVPPDLRSHHTLGRGSSSLILDDGEDRVAILTRDQHKAAWLVDGLGIAVRVRQFRSSSHPLLPFHRMPVLHLRMPRLQPLGKDNARRFRRAASDFKALWRDLDHPMPSRAARGVAVVTARFAEWDGHLLQPLMRFFAAVDPKAFRYDIALRNAMQDEDGSIVLVDPVHDPRIMQILRAHWSEERRRQAAPCSLGNPVAQGDAE